MSLRSLINNIIRAVGLDKFWVQLAFGAITATAVVVWIVAKLRRFRVPTTREYDAQPNGSPVQSPVQVIVQPVQDPAIVPLPVVQPQPIVQPQPVIPPQPVQPPTKPKPTVRKGRKAKIEMNMDEKLAELTNTRDSLLQEFMVNPEGVWGSEEARKMYTQTVYGIELLEGVKDGKNKEKIQKVEPR